MGTTHLPVPVYQRTHVKQYWFTNAHTLQRLFSRGVLRTVSRIQPVLREGGARGAGALRSHVPGLFELVRGHRLLAIAQPDPNHKHNGGLTFQSRFETWFAASTRRCRVCKTASQITIFWHHAETQGRFDIYIYIYIYIMYDLLTSTHRGSLCRSGCLPTCGTQPTGARGLDQLAGCLPTCDATHRRTWVVPPPAAGGGGSPRNYE